MDLAVEIYYNYDAVGAQMGVDETVQAALRVKCPNLIYAHLGTNSIVIVVNVNGQVQEGGGWGDTKRQEY